MRAMSVVMWALAASAVPAATRTGCFGNTARTWAASKRLIRLRFSTLATVTSRMRTAFPGRYGFEQPHCTEVAFEKRHSLHQLRGFRRARRAGIPFDLEIMLSCTL